MKADLSQRVSGASRVPPRPAARPRSSASSQPVSAPLDRTELSPVYLTPDGRLRVIVSLPPGHCSGAFQKKCRRDLGARIVDELPLVNGFTAEVSPRRLKHLLKSLPEGARVDLDRRIPLPDPRKLIASRSGEGQRTPTPALDVSRALIGIEKVWERGYTGKGQTIAVIDSGVYPHPDLEGKITHFVDFSSDARTKPYDPFGHGTHVTGVAVGSGIRSAGKYRGVAPDAEVVALRITTVAEAIKALQWVVENRERYHIGVVNMSLGDYATRSYRDDPWAQAAEKAVEAGLVVVVAAGNEGPQPGTISTPGVDPEVITVGALDDSRTLKRDDDAVASFSSVGPTPIDNLPKPDLLAPGVSIFGPLAPGTTLDVPELPHLGKDYIAISGTSMATPMVAGVAALLRQANPDLDPHAIKEILKKSADRYLKVDENHQGAGLMDAEEALELALAARGGSGGPASPA